MLFNSYIFIFLFLPICVLGWYLLNQLKSGIWAKAFLLGMSLWFYAYFNIKYLPLIIASIVINYLICLFLQKSFSSMARKSLFIIGIVGNIGLLFYYKYLGFFVENINSLFSTDFFVQKIILPLGISFFTFQQVSFVIDCYKKRIYYSFLDYALFVSFFPQLIAGPIVLHDEIIPQFADSSKKKINYINLSKGLFAFSFGLAKKVIVADTFGNLANLGFSNIPTLDSTNAILVMLAYTIQIYFDFSGYCDMATGISLLFNIELPQNFNSPYRSLDMGEFWKKWHITLTRFLTQNVYIPLGGNCKGLFRTYLNRLLVFTLSGLWHGANWTFVLWGILNGFAVVLSSALSKPLTFLKKKFSIIPWLATFLFINVSWVYFRADSIKDANHLINTIFQFDFGKIRPDFIDSLLSSEFELVLWLTENISSVFVSVMKITLFFLFFLFAIIASIKFKNTNERLQTFTPSAKNLLTSVFLLIWSVVSLSGVSSFLYFNF
ncbi:MAG: MBOAT family protein [Clostridia bacterium]|nr:MBOAT family protein [Clostridia bacterium]